MKDDLIRYIANKLPISFLNLVSEHLEAAFFDAYKYAQTFDLAERARILGQLRHYRQNAALRKAATEAGLTATAPHTNRKGERFTLVTTDNLVLSRIGVPFHKYLPRPSKYKKTIAEMNQHLEPVQGVLLVPEPIRPPTNALGCLIVTINPSRLEPQSTPSNIAIGVPHSNLKGWHLFEPISKVLAACNAPQENPVPDLAWATLRKQLDEAEEQK